MMGMDTDERQPDGRWSKRELRSLNAIVLIDSIVLALIALSFLIL